MFLRPRVGAWRSALATAMDPLVVPDNSLAFGLIDPGVPAAAEAAGSCRANGAPGHLPPSSARDQQQHCGCRSVCAAGFAPSSGDSEPPVSRVGTGWSSLSQSGPHCCLPSPAPRPRLEAGGPTKAAPPRRLVGTAAAGGGCRHSARARDCSRSAAALRWLSCHGQTTGVCLMGPEKKTRGGYYGTTSNYGSSFAVSFSRMYRGGSRSLVC
eukprot:scaffold15813_cov63-Phaeocystis_antarctica.AAC.4